jgi:hypothetical protein
MVLIKYLMDNLERVFVFLCRLYGIVTMILSLTKAQMLIFYRLSVCLRTPTTGGSACAYGFWMQPSGCNRLAISTTRVADSLLRDCKLHNSPFLFIFCWLTFTCTLCDS